KLGRYRAVLRQGGGFPPLVGLGGDGTRVTENVLLCDGYHRATAMGDVGMHFAWMWLAVGTWQPALRVPALAHCACQGCAGRHCAVPACARPDCCAQRAVPPCSVAAGA